MEGAETAGVDMMHSCFDKKFDAAGYKWEGTCGEDPTKICFDEEGWTMNGDMCKKGCKGVATHDQIDALHKECDNQGKQEFIKGGGSLDEWDVARIDGAADKGGAMLMDCFDTEFAKKGYKWESTCDDDAALVCTTGGWSIYGGQCKCPGVVTMSQIDDIHVGCDEKGRIEFVKGGGDAGEWDISKDHVAADAGTDMLGSCFDKEFAAAGYQFEGKCKDDATVVCWEGGWSENGEACDCQGVPTFKEVDAIHAACEEKGKKKFIQLGGTIDAWDIAMNDGATIGALDMFELCFDKSFAAAGYAWQGKCKDDATMVCLQGGWTINDGTKCECQGLATENQIQELQEACDAKGRQEFTKKGGSTDDWDKSKADGAVATVATSMKACFSKQMESQGLSFMGVCKDETAASAPTYDAACKLDRVERMARITESHPTAPGALCMDCQGTITLSQRLVLAQTCDAKARATFVMSGGGGNPMDYEKAVEEAAVKSMVATFASCTDKMLKAKKIVLGGVCKGSNELCVAGVSTMPPHKPCECVAAAATDMTPATDAQMLEMTAFCEKKSSEAFVGAGGDAGGSLASAVIKAAENLLESSTTTCFKKQLKKNKKSFEGTCSLNIAMKCDASTVDLETCGVCTGAATLDDIDVVQATCLNETVMVDFTRGGGDANDLPSAKENARTTALANVYTACFDKREKSKLGKLIYEQSKLGKLTDATVTVLDLSEYVEIGKACSGKSRSTFLKLGGNITTPVKFQKDMKKASAESALNAGSGCFKRLFKRKKYDYTSVTNYEIYSLRVECADTMEKIYQRSGGNTTEFKTTGLLDLAEQRRKMAAQTNKGCIRSPNVCDNATIVNNIINHGGSKELATKDVEEGLGHIAIKEVAECIIEENNGYTPGECMDVAKTHFEANGGSNMTDAFAVTYAESMQADHNTDIRADSTFKVPAPVEDLVEMRERQEGAQACLASVSMELAQETEKKDENFTEIAVDVFLQCGGNESNVEDAIELAADQVAAKVEASCVAAATASSIDSLLMVDQMMAACVVDACIAFEHVHKMSPATKRRRLAGETTGQDCEVRAGLGQIRRLAVNTNMDDPANISAVMKPFASLAQQISENSNVTTIDEPDTVIAMKIKMNNEDGFVVDADGRLVMESYADKTDEGLMVAGRQVATIVGAAADCDLGQEDISPGLTSVTIYATCAFRDLLTTEAGIVAADAKEEELETMFSAFVDTVAATRRLGDSRRVLRSKTTVKSKSTQVRKNCKVDANGERCPSTRKALPLPAGLITLIVIGILFFCVCLCGAAFCLIKTQAKSSSVQNTKKTSDNYKNEQTVQMTYTNPNQPTVQAIAIPTN